MNKPMPSVRRKATNISLDSGLLEQARAQQWRADNTDALASSNHHVEDQGLLLARFRRF